MHVQPANAWSSSSSDGSPKPKKKFMVKIKPHPLAASAAASQPVVILQPVVTPPAQASPKGQGAAVVSSSPKGWSAPLPAWLSQDMINASLRKSRKSSSSDSASKKKSKKFPSAIMSKVPRFPASLFVPAIAPPPKYVAKAIAVGSPVKKKSSRSSSGSVRTDGWGLPPNINTDVGSAVVQSLDWGTPRGSPVKKSGSSSPKFLRAMPRILQPIVTPPAQASIKGKGAVVATGSKGHGAVVATGSSSSESNAAPPDEKFLTDFLKGIKTQDKLEKRLARYRRLMRENRISEAKKYSKKHNLSKHILKRIEDIEDIVNLEAAEEVGNSPSNVVDITPPGYSPSNVVNISSSGESPSGKKNQPLSFGKAYEQLGLPVKHKSHKGAEVVSKSSASGSKKKAATGLDQLHNKVMNVAVSPTFKPHNPKHGHWM
jgi:hypothetical protein